MKYSQVLQSNVNIGLAPEAPTSKHVCNQENQSEKQSSSSRTDICKGKDVSARAADAELLTVAS